MTDPHYKQKQRVAEAILDSRKHNVLQPTLQQRLRKLNPRERHEALQWARSAALRHSIRSILAQARRAAPAKPSTATDNLHASIAASRKPSTGYKEIIPVITHGEHL